MHHTRRFALLLLLALVSTVTQPAVGATTTSHVTVSAAAPAAAAPAPKSRDVNVVHSNISGAQPVGGGGNGTAPNIDRVVDVLANNPATDVVTMNEVCWNQALYFLQHRAWNWTFSWTSNKFPDENGQRFCPEWQPGHRPLGEFIASPWPLTNPVDFCLQFNGGVRDVTCDNRFDLYTISLLCIDMNYKNQGRIVTVCTTHLPATGSAEPHALAIRGFLRQHYPANRPIVLTGDLNESPQNSTLDALYRQRLSGQLDGAGDFLEADQTNQSAFGAPWNYSATCRTNGVPALCRSGKFTAQPPNGAERKIDHVFVSWHAVAGRFAGQGQGVVDLKLRDNPYSHHKILVALPKMEI